jgi:hypothetical protein
MQGRDLRIIWDTILAYDFWDWGKLPETWANVADLRADVIVTDLQNTKQSCQI